jgi:pimeloyl-ACP methyl ester carboxylesterase
VLPHVQVETIDGQAHMAMRNVPDRVARLIQDFLKA